MVDPVVQDFDKICEIFKEMRDKMHHMPKYSEKLRATNPLYEAIRQFAYEIGLVPPCIPIGDDSAF